MEYIARIDSIPKLKKAWILDGATPWKDPDFHNVSTIYRGQIYKEDGTSSFAIIKDISAKELCNEIMGSMLGVMLGLPLPPAYLAFCPDGRLAIKHAPAAEGGHLLFASEFISASTAGAILKADDLSESAHRKVAERLMLGNLSAVYEFDTWCANTDRHFGNIMLNGEGNFFLIDQGYCFTGPNWQADQLLPHFDYGLRLSSWLTPHLLAAEIDKLAELIGAVSTNAGKLDVNFAGREWLIPTLIGEPDFVALVDFLKERLPFVIALSRKALGRML